MTRVALRRARTVAPRERVRCARAVVAWLALIEKTRPMLSDWLGAALCLAGAAIILLGPRLHTS